VLAPLADLLLPSDLQQGYIHEPSPQSSVLPRLKQAVEQWEAEGGEQRVGGSSRGPWWLQLLHKLTTSKPDCMQQELGDQTAHAAGRQL
jgi:hypothetical protein